jgi:hypothetical protein
MEPEPELLDVVELREPRGDQPAGAIGAIVELLPTEALIEIVDEHGRTAELLTVPYEALRIQSPSRPVAEPPDTRPREAATQRDSQRGTYASLGCICVPLDIAVGEDSARVRLGRSLDVW